MALGAAATGARAATGSTGQGLALMQEAIAEAALDELPLVIFNMAPRPAGLLPGARAAAGRATTARSRLAPRRGRGRELTQLAFHLADKWRTPGHRLRRPPDRLTQMTVEHDPGRATGTAARQALGARRQLRRHRPVEGDLDLAASASTTRPGSAPTSTGATSPTKYDEIAARRGAPRRDARRRRRHRRGGVRHHRRSSSTTSSTSCAPTGTRIGTFRPITLWPFPCDALADAAAGACEQVLVFELNAGQMVDDVRLAVDGARARALDRRREPRRVRHAPGRPPRRRRDPRADPRGD